MQGNHSFQLGCQHQLSGMRPSMSPVPVEPSNTMDACVIPGETERNAQVDNPWNREK